VRAFEGATPLVKDGHSLRQQNANGPDEVAEATLTPARAIIVWVRLEAMTA
jgi:hypothetical protein